MSMPLQNKSPDFGPLKEVCLEYMQHMDSDGNCDAASDLQHYIFEEAINCLYGKDAWKWINARAT